MTLIDDYFPKRFLDGADLHGRHVEVEIESIEELEALGPRREDKLLVLFAGKHKGLLLNRTNANQIAAIANSRDTVDWPGTRIVLYPVNLVVAGAPRTGIRVAAPDSDEEDDDI